MFKRLINPLKSDSFFIFGARGTGKSFWVESQFSEKIGLKINLLNEDEYLEYTKQPQRLKQYIGPAFSKSDWIVIDEIQRVPKLLNVVHSLIEERGLKFILTGSSARKLKQDGANLLAGRAFLNYLYPLTHLEIGEKFDLNFALQWGSLPKVLNSSDQLQRSEFLKTYIQLYIRQEIKEEQAVKNIDPFLRFIDVAAQSSGQILNMSNIGKDVGVDSHTVARYFEVLADTMMGFYLEPFHHSVRKRQTKKSKFYLFDLGVKRALQNLSNITIEPKSVSYGLAFEQFIILECIRLNDYFRTNFKFSYLRTKDDLEIDLIIERPGQKLLLIEIKSSDSISDVEIKKLEKIKNDLNPCELMFLCQEKKARYLDFCEILPWQEGLKRIFAIDICNLNKT